MGVKRSADLESAVQAALEAAARTGETQWVGLQAEISPCDVLAAFEASESRDRFYWERPSEGRSIAAFGCAAAIEAEGEGRFSETSKRADQLFSRPSVQFHDLGDRGNALVVQEEQHVMPGGRGPRIGRNSRAAAAARRTDTPPPECCLWNRRRPR